MKLLIMLLLALDPLPKKYHGVDPDVHFHANKPVTAGMSLQELKRRNRLYDKVTREFKQGKITKAEWQIKLLPLTK